MVRTNLEIRQRLNLLEARIRELRSPSTRLNRQVECLLVQLETEDQALRALLVTRRLQVKQKVVDLARWRDGFGEVEATRTRRPEPPAEAPPSGRVGERRRD